MNNQNQEPDNPSASEGLHGVVRFITAGSVDDGKSTLIGRLLYDSKAILSDQIQNLSKSKHARVQPVDAAIDLALLTDGLEAEREQGITIDVAYRYFSTPRRKFIVADAPGHEQYTRNLVTGASQSDVAVILVDATRVDLTTNPVGLLDQTKRHSSILHLLGLRHVAVAVNKMDLLDFDQTIFDKIKVAVEDLAKTIGLPSLQVIPLSALRGDNVVSKSTATPWYKGPCLLEWLEALDHEITPTINSLRLPVQAVVRQDGSLADDFRGYVGRVEAGRLISGQAVKVLPNGAQTQVVEIFVPHQKSAINVATIGEVVAIRLADDVDISRGDMLVSAEDEREQPTLTKNIQADLCWLDAEPLSMDRKYIVRHTTQTVFAKVKAINKVLDIKTLSHGINRHAIKTNDIGEVEILLQKPIAADVFNDSPSTGAFILIDPATNHTVAAGMIRKCLS